MKEKLNVKRSKKLKPNPTKCARQELSDAEISAIDAGTSPYVKRKIRRTLLNRTS